jgi:hypothetical protein
LAGSWYISPMARKPKWSRRLTAPVVPLDGGPMRTLHDIGAYMKTLGGRFRRALGNARASSCSTRPSAVRLSNRCVSKRSWR